MSTSKKNILFYYPSNKRTIAMETLLIALNNNTEYNLIALTTCEKGDLHYVLEENGIKTYTYIAKKKLSVVYYIKHLVFLINFCKKHKIDFIHSHLQEVNIIALFAQYFIKAKVIIFRHHFQYLKNSTFSGKRNKNEKLFDFLINRLAKIIVVPSSGVYNGMIKEEGANPNKIKIIPYTYDFEKYHKPDIDEVEIIKTKYPAKLRLIMVSRLIKYKQHHVVFPVIKELINEGLDIKLIVLDEGPEEEKLKDWILQNNMEKHIFMLGFRRDFINYMAASDVLIQPSLTDASNSVAKEMALLTKIVIVSENVGDYSDYIVDGKNGFLLPLKNPQKKLINVIKGIYYNNHKYSEMGQLLKESITSMFGVENSQKIVQEYINLMK